MEWIFIAWLGLIPFVTLYGAYEGPKVFWFWAGGCVLSAFWAYRFSRKASVGITTPDRWLLTFTGVLTIASLFGVHPVDSLIGGSYRHQGVLFFFTLTLVSMTLKALSVTALTRLRLVLMTGMCIETTMLIFQRAHMSRPSGTFGEPNAAAGYVMMGLYWVLQGRLSHWTRVMLICLMIAGIIVTGSRTALIAASFVLMGYLIPQIWKLRQKTIIVSILTGCIICVGVLGYVYVRASSITRPVSKFENRQEFWRVGFGEFIKRPILGYGAESEEIIYDNYYKSISMPLVDFMIDRSHNIFLDVALWSGIIGLIPFLIWMRFSVGKIMEAHDIVRCSAVIAWIFFACVQPVGVVLWIQLLLLVNFV